MSFFDRFKKKQERERLAQRGASRAPSNAPAADDAAPKPVPSSAAGSSAQASDAYRVLLRLYVTEKLSSAKGRNLVAFVVAQDANKPEVLRAVRALYGVTPAGIRMQHVRGKWVRYGRSAGKQRDWKKAILTLKEGDTITPEKA